MDIISDKSRDLFGALAFLSGDEKEEFFRWALENKNQNNISHHMLFGHPYYHLTLVHGALETTVPMEFINKTHRDIIIEYTTKGPFASRVLINELLFFRVANPQDYTKAFVVAFTLAGLSAFCKARSDTDQLTQAELRTLAQLLTGVELKKAALDDSVSYETKRTQLKSINAKLGFGRQIDLVAELLSDILLEIISHTAAENVKKTTIMEQYLTMYAPRQIRHYKVQSKRGNTIPVIDLGPISGKPMILLQTAIPANIGEEFIDGLHEHDIRLLCPVRNGALNPEDPLISFEDHLDHAVDGITTAFDLIGVDTCVLHASGPSSRIAIEFARRNPKAVAGIIFQSIMDDKSAHFFSSPNLAASISNLAVNNPLALNLVLKFLKKKIQDPLGPQKLLTSAFQKNPQDLALLKKEMFSPELSERLRFILSNSIYALLHDFRLIADAGWDQVAELDLPMLFIHGENDKICTLASVKKLVGQLQQARVMTIEGMERLPVDQQRVSIMNALNATIDKWY